MPLSRTVLYCPPVQCLKKFRKRILTGKKFQERPHETIIFHMELINATRAAPRLLSSHRTKTPIQYGRSFYSVTPSSCLVIHICNFGVRPSRMNQDARTRRLRARGFSYDNKSSRIADSLFICSFMHQRFLK